MAAVKLVTLLLVLLAGCGGDDDEETGNPADRVFVARMVFQHENAIDLARVAVRRGESAFVRRLATRMIETHPGEVARMRAEDAALEREGVEIDAVDVPKHGVDPSGLQRAEPFDPVFLRAMISHHEGSQETARSERDHGGDPELKELAVTILERQQLDAARMRDKLGAGGAGDRHNP